MLKLAGSIPAQGTMINIDYVTSKEKIMLWEKKFKNVFVEELSVLLENNSTDYPYQEAWNAAVEAVKLDTNKISWSYPLFEATRLENIGSLRTIMHRYLAKESAVYAADFGTFIEETKEVVAS